MEEAFNSIAIVPVCCLCGSRAKRHLVGALVPNSPTLQWLDERCPLTCQVYDGQTRKWIDGMHAHRISRKHSRIRTR